MDIPATYEYNSANLSPSSGYLWRPLLETCKSLGAKRILDIGCGTGGLCSYLASNGLHAEGCDFSESGLEFARKTYPHITFHKMGVYDNPESLGRFDAAISMEVIEHLYSPRELPRFAKTILKPGGHLLVTTPYHGYLKNLLISVLGKWDKHHDPLWDGGHIKFWSRPLLTKLLNEQGFSVQSFLGAGRIPYIWKSMVIVSTLAPSAPPSIQSPSKKHNQSRQQ